MGKLFALGVIVVIAGCGTEGPAGPPGAPGGSSAQPCTVTGNGDGSATIHCPDGSSSVVRPLEAKATLVRVDREPAGKNCPYGGSAIRSGMDQNSNGLLEDSEVGKTNYVCNGTGPSGGSTVIGDYEVVNSVDLALLNGVTKIDGLLRIRIASDVSLPQLVEVTRGLEVAPPNSGVPGVAWTVRLASLTKAPRLRLEGDLAELRCPSLVGPLGYLHGNTGLLEVVEFAPSVVLADADVELIGLPKVTSFGSTKFTGSLQRLFVKQTGLIGLGAFALANKTDADVLVEQNDFLTSLAGFENATAIRSLALNNNPGLVDHSALSNLKTADGLVVMGRTGFTNWSLPAVTSAKRLTVSGTQTLTTISFPELTTLQRLEVQGNATLTTLALPKLTAVSDYFDFFNNAALKTCTASALRAQLVIPPTSTRISGNTGIGSCP